jgi:hypothetical protein
MQLRLPRWAALTAATAFSLASVVPQIAMAQTAPLSSPTCTFQFGFAEFVQVLSTDIVGTCRESEHLNKYNGNVEQLASNGLLYWRPCDNTTVFTDGYVTWLNGPSGIQNRLAAGEPFDWEAITSCAPQQPPIPVVSPPSAPPVAPIATPILPPPPPPAPAKPAATVCPDKIVSIRNADLTNLDRRGANYACADMFHAKLLGTDLSNATLDGANLATADLSRANFAGVHAPNAVFMMAAALSSKANKGPNFYGADMRATKLSGAKLNFSDFRYVDLSNADLSRAALMGSDFRGADLRAADLSQADFTDANLTGAYLCGANTAGTIFLRAIGVSKECS